jgi:zinc protease
LCLFQPSVWSPTKLIEKATNISSEVIIPCENHPLPNGLKLIIHENHSDTLVHVDITHHVQSAREDLKKSGFAHFIEHMMFQVAENRATEEHFKLISNASSPLNGSTNRNRTNYYEAASSNQLELRLDRSSLYGFFLKCCNPRKI